MLVQHLDGRREVLIGRISTFQKCKSERNPMHFNPVVDHLVFARQRYPDSREPYPPLAAGTNF